MTITRLHMSVTILIALALHGGIAMWLVLPTPAPLPAPPPKPLRVSLLAAVVETTVNSTAAISGPPPPEPILKFTPAPPPKPQSVPKPKPIPETVIQEAPEPQPSAKSAPEPVQTPVPIQGITLPFPTKPSIAPLDAAATVQYGQLFRAWLEKHKIYPRHAQRLRIEGEGMLRILIDRTGRIQHVTLEKRTGNRLLDKAALEMAQRADPFPPIPENDSRRELEFIVPVVFTLH